MTDLRDCDTMCPFCGKYLHWAQSLDCNGTIVKMLYCTNPGCEITESLLGSEDMWAMLGVYEKTQRMYRRRLRYGNDLAEAIEECGDLFKEGSVYDIINDVQEATDEKTKDK